MPLSRLRPTRVLSKIAQAPAQVIQKVQNFPGPGSAGKAGWALREGAPVIDKTDRLIDFLAQAKGGDRSLPEDASQYRYVVVGGLLGEHLPGYLEGGMDRLAELGLVADRLYVPSEAPVLPCAQMIRDTVLSDEDDRPIVFIGQSAGGIHITAALSLYPELAARTRGVGIYQSPYGGSPIASDIHQSDSLRTLVGGAFKLHEPRFRETLYDLSYEGRQAFLKEHRYPSEIPTVAVATTSPGVHSPYLAPTQYIRRRYGWENDGMVTKEDAFVPGCYAAALPGLSHMDTTLPRPGRWKVSSGDMMQALVRLVLEKATLTDQAEFFDAEG